MKSLSMTRVALVLLLASTCANAQQQQQQQQQQAAATGQQSTAVNPPPPSNLGQQVATPPPPQIVYPAPGDIAEESLQDLEDLQLTPEQVERLKRLHIQREQGRATPYTTPPKPITRTLFINLDPGVSPPVLRLTSGQQSSIVFSDTSGQPWFIDAVSVNRGLFDDGRGSDSGGDAPPTNVLTLEAVTPAAYGNVTVRLRGLSTPVIFILSAAQDEVDMRVDAKVPGHNPDSVATVTTSMMPSIDDALSYFLDGVPPKDAKQLEVSGLDGVDAWLYRDNMYVRAKADAQYPAYLAAARSTSGVAVYRFAGFRSSITFLVGGQAVTIFVQ
ncbi:DotH/IcmK family type IV secretion protein (plasmid) [Xanthomonas campestris pv. passiflorae]